MGPRSAERGKDGITAWTAVEHPGFNGATLS